MAARYLEANALRGSHFTGAHPRFRPALHGPTFRLTHESVPPTSDDRSQDIRSRGALALEKRAPQEAGFHGWFRTPGDEWTGVLDTERLTGAMPGPPHPPGSQPGYEPRGQHRPARGGRQATRTRGLSVRASRQDGWYWKHSATY